MIENLDLVCVGKFRLVSPENNHSFFRVTNIAGTATGASAIATAAGGDADDTETGTRIDREINRIGCGAFLSFIGRFFISSFFLVLNLFIFLCFLSVCVNK